MSRRSRRARGRSTAVSALLSQEVLQTSFDQAPEPSNKEVERLSSTTGLSEDEVRQWFAQRRLELGDDLIQPWKVQQEDEEDAPMHDSEPEEDDRPTKKRRTVAAHSMNARRRGAAGHTWSAQLMRQQNRERKRKGRRTKTSAIHMLLRGNYVDTLQVDTKQIAFPLERCRRSSNTIVVELPPEAWPARRRGNAVDKTNIPTPVMKNRLTKDRVTVRRRAKTVEDTIQMLLEAKDRADEERQSLAVRQQRLPSKYVLPENSLSVRRISRISMLGGHTCIAHH